VACALTEHLLDAQFSARNTVLPCQWGRQTGAQRTTPIEGTGLDGGCNRRGLPGRGHVVFLTEEKKNVKIESWRSAWATW
jgi:hypothetical protein